jgi:hypothetical protein
MNDLIEALQIFAKYANSTHPTHCEHDTLMIVGIDPNNVSKKDKEKLDSLGFFVSDGNFVSFRFGSA